MSEQYTPNIWHPVLDDRWQTLVVNPPDTVSAVKISSTQLRCRVAVVYGQKEPGTSNSATAWMGSSATELPFELPDGGQNNIQDPNGKSFDLSDWYIKITQAGDGCVVLYRQ